MAHDPAPQRWTLPAHPRSIAAARTIVQEAAAGSAQVEDAVLAVSELVTNAMTHGHGPVDLEVSAGVTPLRVSVSSVSPSSDPEVLGATSADDHGRGLAIVTAVASRWGWTRHGERVVVWAEFDGP